MGDSGKGLFSVPTEAPEARPSSVRWRILALLLIYVALCHFNRLSISVAGNERILKDHQGTIQPTDMGWVYNAYLIVYTLLMTPGGRLIDRWGPRRALVLVGFGSAAFVVLTGMAGFAFASAGLLVLSLVVARGLLGAVSAPVHPSGARVVWHWFPLAERTGINGLVIAFAIFGIASTYLVFGTLMDWLGWPAAFVVCGIVTAALAVGWTAYAADYPAQHPGVNRAERTLIDPADADPPTSPVPIAGWANDDSKAARADWGALLRNRSLMCLTVSYGAVSYVQYLFFYWMQFYFEKQLGLPTWKSRLYATICTVAMGVGTFGGGWLADRFQKRGYLRGRSMVAAVGMTLSAMLLVLGLVRTEPLEIVTWFALALAAVGAAEGPVWATAVELGGRQGGTAAGIANTGGNAGGLVAPIATPFLAQYIGWEWAIGVGSLICLLGAVLWWWIDPSEGRGEHSSGG